MDTFWTTSFPTWLVAIGTIGAFATGGAVLLREVNRDRERDLAQERKQASSVASWPARIAATQTGMSIIRSILMLSNASQEPVYRLRVEFQTERHQQVILEEIEFLAPGAHERELPTELREVWVKSEDGWVRRGANPETVRDPLARPWTFSVGMTFTDASGKTWHRGADGSLRRQ
jgi:hypothetical protein